MIIAAYAGVGKTFFAQHVEGAVDLVTMPHSWILPPPDKDAGAFESEKGAHHFLCDPRYPDNYILEILKAEQKYRYVLIPTDIRIIRLLREEYERKVILCYPTQEQENDYRERFLARGNSEEFLEIFIDCWESFLTPFWKQEVPGKHLPLLPGEFLMDKKREFDHAEKEGMSGPIPNSVIGEIMERQAGERGDFALYLLDSNENLLYRISNIDCGEERSFLYNLGRKIYEETNLTPLVAPWRRYKEVHLQFSMTDDRDKLRSFVEAHRRITDKKE